MLRLPRARLPKPQEQIKTSIAITAGTLVRAKKSPDQAYGELFRDVQQRNVLGDGKTFVDLIPKKRTQAIKQEYALAKQDPDFDLREFISRHFYEFAPHKDREAYQPEADTTIDEHIEALWHELERRNRKPRGSLMTLPYHYIVPGGRFSEQFYWDSYFIMLGLAANGHWTRISGMMKNYAYMIRKHGFIPTANRTYFLSRSQPPYFALMVRLLAKHQGKRRTYLEYLPYMLAEYRWWLRGRNKLEKQEHKAYARLVEMPDGSLMGRYYDNKATPRPESLREDVETAEHAEGRAADRLYLHLRAAAESGWDFSSRWFLDPQDIKTIHTADIVPVDLNCLLYTLEQTIADSYRMIKQPLLARKFERLASHRAAAINKYCWNEREGVYSDYNFHHFEATKSITLATVYPLYARIASKEQADSVARRIKQDFLKDGGLVTSLVNSGQQWDSPNGWAPLQWTAIVGLRHYGHHALADEIKDRWLKTTERVFERERKLIEKYDVIHPEGLGGGGEYPLQDGFGWTNGVYAALKHEER
ncbi:MAG TPA: alpha,alpha-trehalase TreF [Patescibacteria group bacterium]|jgi:alpha,alpha-trehalase|nr:alpha,alpha-trehalase TreF [Patescibacteria group bacterium]